MEPGPIPILTASTPALINASAPSAVATLPPTTSIFLKDFFMFLMASKTPLE